MKQNLEIFCSVKSPKNGGGKKWSGLCLGCCSFCKKKCELRTCGNVSHFNINKRSASDLCCWRRTLLEMALGRIDDNADKESYLRRRVEYYLKQGYREDDRTWEGAVIKRLRERYG